MNRYARLTAVLVLPMLLLLCGPALAQTGGTDRDFVARSAEADRQFAADLLERAQKWRDLADTDRKNAAEVEDPEFKQDWLDTASQNDQQAKDLEDWAAQLQQRADAEEKQAEQMGAAAAPPPPTPAQTTPAAPAPAGDQRTADLVDFIGQWQDQEHNWDFVLEHADIDDPAKASRVKLTERKVNWGEGLFEAGTAGGKPTRMVFEYFPKASEMDQKIPPWARQQVEGKLKWKLELTHDESNCVCADSQMEATWYPGEVTWWDGTGDAAGTATVTGEGKPVKFTLTKADDDVELLGYFAPVILVHVGDPARAKADPITYLIKEQRFQVQVLMSREDAQKRGDTISVTIKNKHGGSIALPLTLAPQTRSNFVVRYEERAQLMFPLKQFGWEGQGLGGALDKLPDPSKFALELAGGYYKYQEQGDPESPTAVQPLDLDVDNGEQVQFTLDGGAVEAVSVYDTPIKVELGRYDDEFARLALLAQGLLTAPGVTPAQREAINRHMQLIKNARTFINDVGNTRLDISLDSLNYSNQVLGTVHDRIRLDIAQAYYRSLIFAPDQRWLTGSQVAATADGIVWASEDERHLILSGIIYNRDYRDRLSAEIYSRGFQAGARNALPIAETIVYGVPVAIFHMTPLGDFYIVVTGQDILGNEVDISGRIGAGFGLALSALTFGADFAEGLRTGGRALEEVRHLGQAVEVQHVFRVEHAGAGARQIIGASTAESDMQRLIRQAVEAVEGGEKERCLVGGAKNAVSSKPIGNAAFWMNDPKLLYPNAQILEAPAELRDFRQVGPTCRFEAQDVVKFQMTGEKILPDAALLDREQAGIAKMTQASGADEVQIMAYGSLLAGEVNPKALTVREIANFKRAGDGVTVKIYLKAVPQFHQVVVWDVEYGPVGRLLDRPRSFVLFDTNFPDKLVKVTAAEFDAMLVKPNMRYRWAGKWEYAYNERGYRIVPSAVVGGGNFNADVSYYPKYPPAPP